MWQAALDETDFKRERLEEVADRLIAYAAKGLSDKDVLPYQESIGDVVTYVDRYVKSLSFGDDEEYIQRISEISPEFASPLRRNNWTYKNLEKLPGDFMVKRLTEVGPNERFYVLISLPDNLRQEFLSLLPTNNAKTILVDNLNKAISQSDKELMIKAKEYTKSFTEELRKSLLTREEYDTYLILDGASGEEPDLRLVS